MNMGGFISTYYLQAVEAIMGNVIYNSILIEIVVLAVLAVFFLIYNPYPREK